MKGGCSFDGFPSFDHGGHHGRHGHCRSLSPHHHKMFKKLGNFGKEHHKHGHHGPHHGHHWPWFGHHGLFFGYHGPFGTHGPHHGPRGPHHGSDGPHKGRHGPHGPHRFHGFGYGFPSFGPDFSGCKGPCGRFGPFDKTNDGEGRKKGCCKKNKGDKRKQGNETVLDRGVVFEDRPERSQSV